MRESGKVIKRTAPDIVEVQLAQSSNCAKCGICHFDKNGIMTMDAVDRIGASVGSTVEIDIPESHVIMSSFLIFICPLVAFFGGYLIRGFFLGAAALLVYLASLFFYDRNMKTVPRITRVLYN